MEYVLTSPLHLIYFWFIVLASCPFIYTLVEHVKVITREKTFFTLRTLWQTEKGEGRRWRKEEGVKQMIADSNKPLYERQKKASS